ncbi:hypothetical protein PMG11_08105 [Penicillium brasilianum]|uniref:Uncharacterized protein n=1 Tax=Penicillium brasilianum TaxID=104259 RepID=A0A0F7TUK7_PENBI|nr:hypothetical protein PMG11_08105 [Penicillium brasilianum]
MGTKTDAHIVGQEIPTISALAETIASLVITQAASDAGGMLVALFCTQIFLAEGNMIISLITRNVPGQTKKEITMAMISVV